MPFARPSLTQLRQSAMQDITSSDLPNADGFLRMAVLRVMAWIQAGLAHLHYAYLDYIALQATPATATDETLLAWGALKGVNLKPATQAVHTATWSGTNGVALPGGTPVTRGDGFGYTTQAPGTVSGGTVTVGIIATMAGAAGNATPGTVVTLGTSVPGISVDGAVASTVTIGADQETQDAFKPRMLAAFASPPQGGSRADYVEWAEAVPGITQAWCNPNGNGTGSVIVYVMLDVTEAVFSGFPQGTNGVATAETRAVAATGDQLAVANALFPLENVTALVYVYAPAPQTLDLTITGILPNTAPIKAAVAASYAALLTRKRSPLADMPILQSDIDAAISATAGVTSFTLSAPTTPQTPALGSIFTPGTITWA